MALLRKENESLKTELRWKDHLLLNIQNAQLPAPANVRKAWIGGNSKNLSKTKSNDDISFVYPHQKHISNISLIFHNRFSPLSNCKDDMNEMWKINTRDTAIQSPR